MDNDLISRSALKEEFLKYKPYAVDFLSLIDNAPTVDLVNDSQRLVKDLVKGNWLTMDNIFYCDKCKKCYPYRTNFCPNCGADMRGEQDAGSD